MQKDKDRPQQDGKQGGMRDDHDDDDHDDPDVVEIGDDADDLKELGLGADKRAALSGDHKSLVPWIEKYRPKKLTDVAHQEEVVKTLRKALTSNNLPHLLFYGPPGTGKTSTILAVARELYGAELMKTRVLELNASMERGIEVIREKVKTFAQLAVGRETVADHPVPPYKIIILDEADSMTKDAQSALRRTMEQYTKVTRFCIICNYVSRIIDPITSRCAKFRFQPLPAAAITQRLAHIAATEHIRADQKAYDQLVTVSEGDLRKAITMLQTASRMVDKASEVLTAKHVVEVAGQVPDDVLRGLMTAVTANAFDKVADAARECVWNAYPVNQVIAQLQPHVIESKAFADTHKAKIAIRLAEADKKLIDGADEYLQLLDVLSFISTTIHEPVAASAPAAAAVAATAAAAR